MKKSELAQLTDKVRSLVQEVGIFLLAEQKTAVQVQQKLKGDYATNVDFASEKMIVNGLKQIASDIPVYGEEMTANEKAEVLKHDLYWVVDPIDGTKNYFRQLPTWGINVALYDAKEKEVVLGIVYFPRLESLFSAYKDGGAFLNGIEIHPSGNDKLDEAMVCMEAPNVTAHWLGEEKFQEIREKIYRFRSWGLGSAMCFTANGGFDAYVSCAGTIKSYDIFPALLIAKEAGCKIISPKPGEVYKEKYPDDIIIITNGKLEL